MRFDGDAENLYLARYIGNQRERYRFVVCGSCCTEILLPWRSRALFRRADGGWAWHLPLEPQDALPRLLDEGEDAPLPWNGVPGQPTKKRGS